MKLQTSIPHRRDGVVRAKGVSGREYVFTASALGSPLTCEIEDQQDLAQLLRIPGCFFPVDDADLEKVVGLLKDADPDGDEDQDADEDADDDPVDMNAPPVEGVGASDEPPIEGAAAAPAPAPAPAARKPRNR